MKKEKLFQCQIFEKVIAIESTFKTHEKLSMKNTNLFNVICVIQNVLLTEHLNNT